jgi:hypothetical protein
MTRWQRSWRTTSGKKSEKTKEERKMIDKDRLRAIMNEMDEVINQAYDLDEELDISSFLERISDINNEIEELIDADDD